MYTHLIRVSKLFVTSGVRHARQIDGALRRAHFRQFVARIPRVLEISVSISEQLRVVFSFYIIFYIIICVLYMYTCIRLIERPCWG